MNFDIFIHILQKKGFLALVYQKQINLPHADIFVFRKSLDLKCGATKKVHLYFLIAPKPSFLHFWHAYKKTPLRLNFQSQPKSQPF
jgi:hypothetical protein